MTKYLTVKDVMERLKAFPEDMNVMIDCVDVDHMGGEGYEHLVGSINDTTTYIFDDMRNIIGELDAVVIASRPRGKELWNTKENDKYKRPYVPKGLNKENK